MTEKFHSDPNQRILILAPSPKDARITCEILQRNNIECLLCASLSELCDDLREGAAGVLIAEEFFARSESKILLRFLAKQPSWSDLPVIFLMRRGKPSPLVHKVMESQGNVLLLERPTEGSMLVSTARAALRDRRRQYKVRDQLEELERRRADLEENEKALNEAKEEAEEANRAKSEFLANMSHEIRTPMTVTLAALELLTDASLEENQSQLVEMASTATNNLLGLINDILDFSKIEARKVDLHLQSCPVRHCLEKAAEPFAIAAERKGLELTVEIAPATPEVMVVDPDRMQQIFTNLIGNALKFTEEGNITLGVAPVERGLRFFVRDTGSGISPEKLNELFESFTQATHKHGGTGLGLAICKGLVELMGGEIGAESCPGEGSTFYFTLPLTEATMETSSFETEKASCGNLPPLDARILLAEDDPALRQMIEMILRKWHCEVESAETGEEVVRLWESGNGDLILMDLQMPQMGGLEASRVIREKEQETGTRIPIIALTARAQQEDKNLSLEAGMDAWVTKPIDQDNLHEMISRLLIDNSGRQFCKSSPSVRSNQLPSRPPDADCL